MTLKQQSNQYINWLANKDNAGPKKRELINHIAALQARIDELVGNTPPGVVILDALHAQLNRLWVEWDNDQIGDKALFDGMFAAWRAVCSRPEFEEFRAKIANEWYDPDISYVEDALSFYKAVESIHHTFGTKT